MNKKTPSEREMMVARFESRIKFKKQQLSKTKKFHREVEADLSKKIRLDQMQLDALRKK